MRFAAPTLARALAALFALAGLCAAQQPAPPKAATTAVTPASTPVELARAAFNAQGGEKFRALKNMMLIGSVDMYSPGSTQSLSGKFGLLFAQDRLRLNIQTPLFQLESIFDGERSYSSMPRVELPPINKLGWAALARFDQPGYVVSALPDKKKERAFRITDPAGNATDFYVDAVTARLIRYEVQFKGLTFSVENQKVQEFEGVLVPVNSVWKIDMPTGPAYAEFKAKEIKLNQTLPDDAFAIPGQ
ncbi:MAG TPA: hypothetical protein VF546_01330 [Pyrinomonadaceae bacterium]|jgi:hypothetical protein